MNTLIAALVGALAAGAVLIGGVHLAQGDQSPVAVTKLYTYSSR